MIQGKGRGVIATRKFRRGDFVVEYHGELLDNATAKIREEEYSMRGENGGYMMFFEHANKKYWYVRY